MAAQGDWQHGLPLRQGRLDVRGRRRFRQRAGGVSLPVLARGREGPQELLWRLYRGVHPQQLCINL